MRMFNANSMSFPNPPEEFSEYLMNAEKYAYQLGHSTYKNECEVMDDIMSYIFDYVLD